MNDSNNNINNANGINQRYRIIGFIIIAAILLFSGYGINLTYFKLHFFVLLPMLGFLLLPPMPLKFESKEIKIVGYLCPLIISVSAIIFSSFWDNYIASKGVWTFDKSQMIGVIGHIPIEEYFWFVDHTLIGSCFVLFLWGNRKRYSENTTVENQMSVRVAGFIIFMLLTVLGIYLLQFDKMLFVAVTLAFFCPVSGLLWLIGGHLLLQQRREMLLAITLVSGYVLLIDAWAVVENVWVFNNQFMTGVKLFGITDWSQIMIYTWATVVVVFPMLIALRMTEIMANEKNNQEDKPIFLALMKNLLTTSN